MMEELDQETLNRLHEIEVDIMLEIDRICKKNGLTYYLIGGTLLGAVRHKGFIPWDDDMDIAMPRKDYEQFQLKCKTDLGGQYYLDTYKENTKYWLPYAKIRKKGTVFIEEARGDIDDGHEGVWVDIFPLDNAKKFITPSQRFQKRAVNLLRGAVHRTIWGKLETDGWKHTAVFGLLVRIPRPVLLKMIDWIMNWNSDDQAPYYINLGTHYKKKNLTTEKIRFDPAVELDFEGQRFLAPRDYDYVLKQFYGDYMVLPPEDGRKCHRPRYINLDGDNRSEA